MGGVAMNESKSQLHILIVDDDRLILATLSRGLRDAGYRVSAAVDGEGALKIVNEDTPDLALLDMRMPGMTGIELAGRLRDCVPFLFLSAFGDADTVSKATEQGALGYLVKPLDVVQILPSLQAAIARSSELGSLREKESQLTTALAASRETAMALGVLMERKGIDRKQAFELLRSHARSTRRSVHSVANELLDASEKLNINI
jgi:AmiR/NasT family two-component response regulator